MLIPKSYSPIIKLMWRMTINWVTENFQKRIINRDDQNCGMAQTHVTTGMEVYSPIQQRPQLTPKTLLP